MEIICNFKCLHWIWDPVPQPIMYPFWAHRIPIPTKLTSRASYCTTRNDEPQKTPSFHSRLAGTLKPCIAECLYVFIIFIVNSSKSVPFQQVGNSNEQKSREVGKKKKRSRNSRKAGIQTNPKPDQKK